MGGAHLKSTFRTMRRETYAHLKAEEAKQQKVSATLKNFFGQNKLYLKSAAEKAVLAPTHIQNKLEAFKQDEIQRKNVHKVNLHH